MVSRSKLPFSINRKCSIFAGCMEQSHRGQGALPTLMLRDAAGSSGFQLKYTVPKKECCHAKLKRVPFWCFPTWSVLSFDWTTMAKLFVMVLSSFDIFRTRYRIRMPPWVWMDVGHVAQSKSFLCSKSNFNLRFVLACSFVLSCIPFNAFRSDLFYIF